MRVLGIDPGTIVTGFGFVDEEDNHLFYSKNVQTVIKLAQVNGIIMLASVNAAIPVLEYTPLEVKLAVVGYVAAKKEQVQHMVSHILRMDKPISSHHEADALGVAICHLHRKVKYKK